MDRDRKQRPPGGKGSGFSGFAGFLDWVSWSSLGIGCPQQMPPHMLKHLIPIIYRYYDGFPYVILIFLNGRRWIWEYKGHGHHHCRFRNLLYRALDPQNSYELGFHFRRPMHGYVESSGNQKLKCSSSKSTSSTTAFQTLCSPQYTWLY